MAESRQLITDTFMMIIQDQVINIIKVNVTKDVENVDIIQKNNCILNTNARYYKYKSQTIL